MGFIGSVFSPWYRWAGRRNPADHACINVALYGKGGRWTMTERGETALRQTPDRFTVGPSSLHWDGTGLTIEVDEITTPHLQRLRGTVRLVPSGITSIEVPLTPEGTHVWRPLAPAGRIEVDFGRPGWRWSGHGYLDSNFGTRALEDDFTYWTWARLPRHSGTTAFYDATRRDGSELSVALHFEDDGSVEQITAPPKARLARSLWTVRRETRADPGFRPHQTQAMLDAPFYTRSAIRTRIDGEETVGVHEALDLVRFANPLIKPMLALRVPRRKNWTFA
ncbi:MAG: carotenoid 1,2-hydratase [Pseudomonadota bacterium]